MRLENRLSPATPVLASAAVVTLGFFVAFAIVSALDAAGIAKTVFAIAGLALLIPALVVRDPRAYGLFLLVLVIPIEFSIRLTKWLADPKLLFQTFGMPPSGTLSLDIYVSDVVLFAMLVPWIVQLALQQRRLYFPKAGYIFILFLCWALMVSLVEAPSLYLSIFELLRKLLYFILFLYIANNVVTTAQLRAVVLGLFIGLAVEAIVVIALFGLNIGSESYLLRDVLYGTGAADKSLGSLTVAEAGSWSNIKRSAGTFAHPSMAAYYFEYILPIVLGAVMAARRTGRRIMFGALFLAGVVSLVLTFSRSGIVGFLIACTVFFPLAWWARLISRRMFAWVAALGVAIALAGTPVLINYLMTRPEALALRFRILDPAIAAFEKRPLSGAGLNNSTAVTEGSLSIKVLPKGQSEYTSTVVHNYHMIVLLDVGIIGYLLYAGFFLVVCLTALRRMREADAEPKIMLVGIVSALLGIWVHNLADPFGGHALQAMWWLEVGLIFAVCRAVEKGAGKTPSLLGGGGSGSHGLAMSKPPAAVPGTGPAGRQSEYRY